MLLGAVLVNNWVATRAETSAMSDDSRAGRRSTARPPAAGAAGAAAARHAIIEVRDIGKSYGSVIALRDVTTTVNAGEVTCVLGDNGAGKSTFIKILAGAHAHSQRRVPRRRGEADVLLAARGAGARHRDGLPGPRGRAADAGLAQLLPRLGGDQGQGPVQAARHRVR